MEYTLFGTTWLCWAFILLAITVIMFMPPGKRRKDSAINILHKKFADGTLSLSDYEERKSILTKDQSKKSNSWF